MCKPKTYYVIATTTTGEKITSETSSLIEAERNAKELLRSASYKDAKIYRQGRLMRQFAAGYNNHIVRIK